MAINFPTNRGQCNPVIGTPGNTDPLQNGDKTNITVDTSKGSDHSVTITYIFVKPASPNTGSWWKSAGRVNNATPIDKIEEGNTSAEVIDTGTNGQFVVSTEGNARMKVTSDGTVKLNGTNIDTDPSIQLNPNGSGAFDGKLTSASTAATDSGTTLVTKDYLTSTSGGGSGKFGYWDRTGTNLSPVNAGDDVFTSGDIRVGNTNASPNISLNADGSAEFSKWVDVDGTGGTKTDNFYLRARNDLGAIVSLGMAGSTRATNGAIQAGNAFIDASINPFVIQAVNDIKFSAATNVPALKERMRISSGGNVFIRNDLVMDNASADIMMNPGNNSGSFLINRSGKITSNVNEAGNSNIGGGSGGGAQINMGSNSGIIFSTFASTTNVNDAITLEERMRINSAGKIILPTGSPGIQFGSPESGGSVTSQTLDDYEEGTWTPTLTGFQAGTVSTGGVYTKIGRFIYGRANFTGGGIASGTNATISLPFNVQPGAASFVLVDSSANPTQILAGRTTGTTMTLQAPSGAVTITNGTNMFFQANVT